MLSSQMPPAHAARRKRIAFARTGLYGLLFWSIATALAHELDDDSATVEAPEVEVFGHYENAVGTSDAASQGVINAALIRDRPALRAGEVLEFVPGMVVTQHSGSGKANQYFVRGINLDHGTDFAVQVDGMPVNLRTHGHGQGYADVNFVIPELVSRIDYSKGPYFAEQGDFSSAGAAHFRMRDRLPENLATVSVGTDHYLRALLGHSPKVGDGDLLYALEWTGYDGPWVNPENLRKLNGLVRYNHGGADHGFSVTGMFYQADWDATDQIPRRAVASGAVDRVGAVDPSDGGETSRYSLSANLRHALGGGQAQADLYVVRYEMGLWSNFEYFLNDTANGDQFQQVDRRTLYGANLHYSLPAAWAGLQMQNRIGLQMRRDDIAEVALNHTKTRQFLSTTRRDEVMQDSVGVFLENTTQWSEWARTLVGLRADYYRFDVRSNLAANSGELDDAVYSPKLGAVFGPWSRTEVFVNAGYGFHSNDARGTVITVDPADGVTPADRVTPLVKTRGAELGFRSELLQDVQSSLALWRLELDSELLFIGDAGTTEAGRPSRRQGIEWMTTWRPMPWLMIDLDVDFSRSKFTDNDPAGSHIPGSIERAVKAGIYVDSVGPWSGALLVRHFGPRPLVEDDSVRSGSTTLTNLRVGYELGKRWRAQLDVLNLFDREDSDIEYYYESRLQGEPGPVADVHFHPVESRQVRLAVSARF